MTDDLFELEVACSLPAAEVRGLSAEDQADAAHALLGRVTTRLADFGFDPNIIATVTSDLGYELAKADGKPSRVVRMPGSKH
jgi:hypothetical protein